MKALVLRCINYLLSRISDIKALESHISEKRSTVDDKKNLMDGQTAEMKNLKKPDAWDTYTRLKSVADGLRNIKFTKAREKYKTEHKAELNQLDAPLKVRKKENTHIHEQSI